MEDAIGVMEKVCKSGEDALQVEALKRYSLNQVEQVKVVVHRKMVGFVPFSKEQIKALPEVVKQQLKVEEWA